MSFTKSFLVCGSLLVSMTFASCSDFASSPQVTEQKNDVTVAKTLPGKNDIIMKEVTDPIQKQILRDKITKAETGRKNGSKQTSASQIVAASIGRFNSGTTSFPVGSWVGYYPTVDFSPAQNPSSPDAPNDNMLNLEYILASADNSQFYTAKTSKNVPYDPNHSIIYNAAAGLQVWYQLNYTGTYTMYLFASDNSNTSWITFQQYLSSNGSITVY